MSNLEYTELVRNHLYSVTGYTHAHHVPHVQHVESCRSDEMAKHGRPHCNVILSSVYFYSAFVHS